MAPHYYVRPDELCDAQRNAERDRSDESKQRLAATAAAPWEERDRRVFARYSPFCHGAMIRVNKTEFTGCARAHFATLSHNFTEVRAVLHPGYSRAVLCPPARQSGYPPHSRRPMLQSIRPCGGGGRSVTRVARCVSLLGRKLRNIVFLPALSSHGAGRRRRR